MEVVGKFCYGLSVPSTWRLVDVQRFDQEPVLVHHWVSTSEQAACVACHTISHRRKKTYLVRCLQDLPASGLTLYHAVKANRYVCENSECSVDTFTEQFAEIADPDARLTHRLKDFIVQQGLDASANALARSLRSIGIRVSRETRRGIQKHDASWGRRATQTRTHPMSLGVALLKGRFMEDPCAK